MARNLRVGVQRGLRQSIGGGLGTGDIFTLSPASFDFARTGTKDSRITFTRSSTGTYVAADGLIKTAASGAARFDHDSATGKSLGLLIEESRTNKINNSKLETGGSGFWQSFASEGQTATWTADSIASPDGTVSAGLAEKDGGGNPRFINSIDIVGADTVLTASVFCKQYQTEETVLFAFYNIAGASYSQATININSAAATLGTGFSGAVVEDFDNSWKRVSVKYTVPSSATGTTATFSLQPSSNGSGMYFWGAQVEVGSFPTSLIITSGSTATRAADVAEITGTDFSDFYNQSEGTMFAEAGTSTNTNNFDIFEYSNGSVNNRHTVRYEPGNTRAAFTGTGGNTSQQYVSLSSPANIKAAATQSLGFAVNGVLTNSAGSSNSGTKTQLVIGFRGVTGGDYINGHIKRLSYFPTLLPNATLQSITS